MNSKHILITGASGLIGTRLTEMLLAQGHTVAHLGRSEKKGASVPTYVWDVDRFTMDPQALDGVDTIIHLAGANLSEKRWTGARKQEIIDSRVQTAGLLYQQLAGGVHSVKTFISASGSAYYGQHANGPVFAEEDARGKDFLADVTVQWEAAAGKMEILGIRVVKMRTGMVLSNRGGALPVLTRPIKWYVGSPLGSGRQYVSWIHLEDLCMTYIKALEDTNMEGAYNAVSPDVVTNRQLTLALAKKLNRPVILPSVPSFALKLLLGEMADMVVKGGRLSCEKIREAGFRFTFGTLSAALDDLL